MKSRPWLYLLVPVLLSAGVVWLSAQEAKPGEPVKVQELSEKLQAREKAAQEKEAQLKELEQRLGTLQATLDKDRQDLQAREKALEEARAKLEAERTRPPLDPQMIKTYEGMAPKPAADALRQLHARNATMAVSLIGVLQPKKAAKILEQLGATPNDMKLTAELLERVGSTKGKQPPTP